MFSFFSNKASLKENKYENGLNTTWAKASKLMEHTHTEIVIIISHDDTITKMNRVESGVGFKQTGAQ